MTVSITSLTQLTIDDVRQNQDLLREIIQEDNPDVDVQGGVFDDLVNYYGAALATVNQENTDLLQQSQSPLLAATNPDLADPDILDAAVSAFGVVRKPGTAAQGTVTIVVSKLASVTIANGALFAANGNQFTADQAYSARTSEDNVQSDTDRVLTPVDSGNYAFTINVTAVLLGTSSRLSKNTAVTPSLPPLNFVKAYATSDFTGGDNVETNAALLARLAEGPAVKALASRPTMQATLRNNSEFANVLATSVIGMGDPEMIRDRHTIFPVSLGGRVDWYVRSQDVSQLIGLTKTATLISILPTSSVWQFSLGRDEVPGFFDVLNIQYPSGALAVGTYAILSDVRGYDFGTDSEPPDIATTVEAVYTRYQTAVIQFTDTETDTSTLAVGDTKNYPVTVRAMPLISDMQAAMANRGTINPAGDVLVKAPIPCFLALNFTINLPPGVAAPDSDTVANALAAVVNQYGFTGRLPASLLVSTIQQFLTSPASVGRVDMWGQLRRPDGSILQLRSSDVLAVPTEDGTMVSPRTVAFILDPADVAISTLTVAIPEI